MSEKLLKNARILIVDDDQDVLLALKILLRPIVKEVVAEKNPEKIIPILSNEKFDLILLDMNYNSAVHTGNEGIFWLRKIRQIQVLSPIIMITAYGDIELAIKSVKEGASDFILKPWNNEKLLDAIQHNLQKDDKKNVSFSGQQQNKNLNQSNIISCAQVMKDVMYKLEKIAPTDANILILGEHGTGKTETARYIHKKSLRSNGPFVHADLGAMTEHLFESELFGHVKGAYTDAREDRKGRFEAAENGTLFLDEIANISLPQQFKLLNVLQERAVTKLGSNIPIPIDIRLISATNVSIYDMANQQNYRKDLIYRLNTIEIILPPLRERDGDISLLAQTFAKTYADKYHKNTLEFESKAMSKLIKYDYPGNIRELQHTIERAVIMSENNVIKEKDISFSDLEKSDRKSKTFDASLNLGDVEKNAIERVIEKHNGNITKAAQELGLTRSSLYRRLGKHNM